MHTAHKSYCSGGRFVPRVTLSSVHMLPCSQQRHTASFRGQLASLATDNIATSSLFQNGLSRHHGKGKQFAPLHSAAVAESITYADASSSPASLGANVRKDFPILEEIVNGQPLVYLDNAATSQKPQYVLQAMANYYDTTNSNVHRGVHALAAQATADYEAARGKVAAFVKADSWREIVFTRNATEAMNLVAYSWGMANLKPGDEIIMSVAEHHSTIVPWQMVAKATGAVIKYVELTKDTQEIDMAQYRQLLSPKTKLVAMVHVSNMLGAVTPMQEVTAAAHKVGALVVGDCCQSVPHMPVDVRTLGCDWIVASSHKLCGPTGIGFLWGRYELLEQMQPWMGGGEMIADVFLEHSTYADPPLRFEAGTPAIAEAIGMGAACDYLSSIGMENVHTFEQEIGKYLHDRLSAVDDVTIYGPSPQVANGRASLCSFNVKGLHATDVSTLLDAAGICVRSGHHCTQPLHRYLGINASARASLYIYNTKQEVDIFVDALKDSINFFRSAGM